jgi:hypothetical protein
LDSIVHTHEAAISLHADQFATGLVLGPPLAAVVTFVGLVKDTVMFNHGNAPLPLVAERVQVF